MSNTQRWIAIAGALLLAAMVGFAAGRGRGRR
jgi:hypothetical protein